MPSPRAKQGDDASYWRKRLRSSEFRKQLSALIGRELQELASLRVRDVVDPKLIRRRITSLDRHWVRPEALADIVVQIQRRSLERLGAQRRSPRDLAGEHLAKHLEALLTQDPEPSEEFKASLDRLVRQEFVSRLLTDLVFTALVAFYQRVNPLFGAFAMRSLEDQIKAFIRGFLPMLQERIKDFALSRQNQHIAHELSRTIARQMLAEPVASYTAVISARQRREAEALARAIVHSAEFDALARQAALAIFDDFYAVTRAKKLGEILSIETPGLAGQLADAVMTALQRDRMIEFIVTETRRQPR